MSRAHHQQPDEYRLDIYIGLDGLLRQVERALNTPEGQALLDRMAAKKMEGMQPAWPEYMSHDLAAYYCGFKSDNTVKKWIEEDHLNPYHDCGDKRVKKSELDAYMKKRKGEGWQTTAEPPAAATTEGLREVERKRKQKPIFQQ